MISLVTHSVLVQVPCLWYEYKWKNHFFKMKGDSLKHQKEGEQEVET